LKECIAVVDSAYNLGIYSSYMEKTVLNIKTGRKLKQDAQKVARGLGLPLGTIMNAYLREFVREKRIMFSIPPISNVRTQKLLQNIWEEADGVEQQIWRKSSTENFFGLYDKRDAIYDKL